MNKKMELSNETVDTECVQSFFNESGEVYKIIEEFKSSFSNNNENNNNNNNDDELKINLTDREILLKTNQIIKIVSYLFYFSIYIYIKLKVKYY
jgi:hypothetical protein